MPIRITMTRRRYKILGVSRDSPGVLEETFAMYPEYLRDVSDGTVNFHNRNLELSHRSRAIKLWLTIRTYGFEKLGSAIEQGRLLAEFAQAVIEGTPEFVVVTPPQLGIVNFEFTQECDLASIARELTDTGYAAVTTTSLRGREALRLCIINPETTGDEIAETLKRITLIGRHGHL